MSDLIERLRETAAARAKATAHDDPNNYLLVVARLSREDADLMAEAAAEIERLRGVLEPFAAVVKSMSQNHLNIEDSDEVYVSGKDLCRAYDVLSALSRPHATKGEAG